MESPNSEQWFRKCCICIPLRLGALIMTYIAVAYTAFVTVAMSGSFTWILLETNGFKGIEIPTNASDKYPSVMIQKFFLAHYAAVLSFLAVFHIFLLTLNIICLIGIHKRRPGLIQWNISFTMTRLLTMISALGYNFLVELDYIVTIIQLLDICFIFYHLVVLHVYRGHLKQELKKEKALKKAEEKTSDSSTEKNGVVFTIPVL